MMEFKIFAPTYKRSDKCNTHKYLKDIVYVVREAEADDYKDVHDNLWIVPNEAQGNLCRIRNYILDNCNIENVLLLDDDIKCFNVWNGNKQRKLEEDEVYEMVQKGFLLAEDLDVVFWGINCLNDKGSYREYTPLGTRSYIGGPFQAHRNNELRYDEKIYLKEDYDMTLQVLNKHRKNLRLNMYSYTCAQANLEGGCADYRTVKRDIQHNDLLQKKWGKNIVKLDKSNKSGKQKNFDINPIIKVPIRGV